MTMFKDLPTKDGRRAYRVVDLFEQELCDFTGAPFAVAVNSCTNALFLSLTWEARRWQEGWPKPDLPKITLPKRTYIGVLQSVLNAGFGVRWLDADAVAWYQLQPTDVVDAARFLKPDLYKPFRGCFVCLSFHSAKQLPIGRGGAILTDNAEAAEWFRAARMDGRAPGSDGPPVIPGWHMPLPPDAAARGLDILSRWTEPPKPLPHTDYEDLSLLWPTKGD